jgi:ribonucleotide reductase alpha subunit
MKSQSPFKNMPPAERSKMLHDNAYAVKEGEMYQKPLNEEEKLEYQKMLVDTTISIQRDDEKLKEIRKEYKTRIKDNEKLRNEAAQAVQYGSITTTGTVYMMDDQEAGMMEIYAEDGTLVNKRPLLPDERQLSFMSVNRTGTHDEV